MLVGVLLIGVGVMTIAWGRWLTIKQLPNVRQLASSEGRDRYDGIMNRSSVKRLMRLPGMIGTIAILVGVAYVLSEL